MASPIHASSHDERHADRHDMMDDMESELMDVHEVAEALGIQPGAVRDAVARGKLAVIRKGGQGKRAGFLLFEREEVERYRRENLGRRGQYVRKQPPDPATVANETEPPTPTPMPSG